MSKLGLSADAVLTTTRAVRKRLDFNRPVEMSVVKDSPVTTLIYILLGPTSSAWPTFGNNLDWHNHVLDNRSGEPLCLH